ncbi:unnamed protein product [Blepharisma stoltei]|uniref:Uncharacterized protein n=1 Tax=Blepharisma stoltei TaxID=1481888 RepID=A0AAU9JX56_9CILI|nr:unnamed protein product [Blepharisma stoltei]
MKNRIRKQEELHTYSALSEIMLRLKKKGYIDKLQQIFLAIYQNEKSEDNLYSEKLKEGIKLIVNGLLEEIFKENIPENFSAPSTPVFEPSRTPVQLKVPSSLSRNSPSSHGSSQMKASVSQKQSIYTLLLRNENELASFSEFNTIAGPSTFGKAKREISLEKRNNSPGPAAHI